MVYIISCNINGIDNKKLEEIRKQFTWQIHSGVLLLPLGFNLVQVVDTPVGIEQVDLEGIVYRPEPSKEEHTFSWDAR